MYPLSQRLDESSRQHQHRLLQEAAHARLLRQILAPRRTPVSGFPSPSLRSRLAAALHSLAAWIDGPVALDPARSAVRPLAGL